MSAVKRYQTEVHNNLGTFATWLPGDRIEIGDIGILLNVRFLRLHSLDRLEHKSVIRDGDKQKHLHFTSTHHTVLCSSASGGTMVGNGLVDASTEISISFNAEGACLFDVSNLSHLS